MLPYKARRDLSDSLAAL